MSASSDPFLLLPDTLQELASDTIYARGVAYEAEHRVTELGRDVDGLYACVDGSDTTYDVRVRHDSETDQLICNCTCPFDWEPFCKHGIATLIAWVHDSTAANVDVTSASAQAIADRRKRAASQVRVTHVAGRRGLGTWRAHSVHEHGQGRSWRVEIRSLRTPMNTCTCPDFALNQLGTCKHIEAVKLRLGDTDGVANEPPIAVAWLDWSAADGPAPRVHVPDGLPAALQTALAAHVDRDGRTVGDGIDAVFQLADLAERYEELVVTHDLLAHARYMIEQERSARRAVKLSEQIRRRGGQLPGIKARLHPYQVEGVAFLVSRGRALLADDMGLGKTLQTIAAASVLMDDAGVQRVLVVCPASLKCQWAGEIRRFTDRTVQVVQGKPTTRLGQYRRRAHFTIVNYELVLREASTLMHELAPDVLVLDEAQRIRNWQTKTAAAVKELQTKYAFVLTGTPLENRLVDLYSVMQVVDPRVLGPLWRFMVDFHVTDEFGKAIGYRNLSELRRRLSKLMLRRNRDVVADQLPERKVVRRDLKLTPRQRQLHDGAVQAAQSILLVARKQKRPLTPGEKNRLMAALQQARMACNAAGLVDKETEGSPKLTELRGLLETLCVEERRKVVVFSQWERMTAMAEQVAVELGIGTVRLHGSVPTAKRGELIGRFEQDSDVGVFLSTDAGATGLNLQAASALINLELPFNPALLEQRIARVHRLGQPRTCLITLLISAASYEERIWELLGGKRNLFAAVVSGQLDDDAVGMDSKAVQLAMEAAQEPAHEPVPPPDRGVVDDDQVATVTAIGPETTPAAPDAPPSADAASPSLGGGVSLAPLVAALQSALGARLRRLFVAGKGLVAIVDRLDEEVRATAEKACNALLQTDKSQDLPVAVVDPPTWAALQRLGGEISTAAVEVGLAAQTSPARSPLYDQAERKLRAAEVLLEQDCTTEAIGLLRDAVVLTLAADDERATLPPEPELAGWLYGELVPAGKVSEGVAALVMRLVGMASAAQIPATVARQCWSEVVELLAR